MPPIHGVAETALYVQDLKRAGAFYETLFNLPLLLSDERMRGYGLPDGRVLLLFVVHGSTQTSPMPGGIIPPHDAKGHQHLAFRIAAADVPTWRATLAKHNIPLESEVVCNNSGGGWGGSTSLYFRDPDGHLLELITPGCWKVY